VVSEFPLQGRDLDTRVTIYKKTDETYQLKLKSSRMFYSEVTHKHGSMPFNLRNFEDEKKAKLAVVECVNHKLIEPFQVLYEKSGKSKSRYDRRSVSMSWCQVHPGTRDRMLYSV
jgi:hypothetical protein